MKEYKGLKIPDYKLITQNQHCASVRTDEFCKDIKCKDCIFDYNRKETEVVFNQWLSETKSKED